MVREDGTCVGEGVLVLAVGEVDESCPVWVVGTDLAKGTAARSSRIRLRHGDGSGSGANRRPVGDWGRPALDEDRGGPPAHVAWGRGPRSDDRTGTWGIVEPRSARLGDVHGAQLPTVL
jgi:hypothetical protein